jgi:hypothetical protein
VALAACPGTSNANIPYSVSHTKSGDGSSTTFYVLACGLGCEDPSMMCTDLKSISLGGVQGGDGSDDCGGIFNVGLAPDGGCKTFSFTANQANADLGSVCPDGCLVKFNMANGKSVVRTIGGERVEAQVPETSPEPLPEPSPEPSPEMSPIIEPIPPNSPEETVTPSGSKTPTPYGLRRRVLAQYGNGRRLSQYGSRRRLNQY